MVIRTSMQLENTDLSRFFNSSVYNRSIKLWVNDTCFVCSRLILAQQSSVFEAQLRDSPPSLVLNDFEGQGVEQAIQDALLLLYGGKVAISMSNIKTLTKFSIVYNIRALAHTCLEYVRKELSIDNIMEFFKLFRYGKKDGNHSVPNILKVFMEERTGDIVDHLLRCSGNIDDDFLLAMLELPSSAVLVQRCLKAGIMPQPIIDLIFKHSDTINVNFLLHDDKRTFMKLIEILKGSARTRFDMEKIIDIQQKCISKLSYVTGGSYDSLLIPPPPSTTYSNDHRLPAERERSFGRRDHWSNQSGAPVRREDYIPEQHYEIPDEMLARVSSNSNLIRALSKAQLNQGPREPPAPFRSSTQGLSEAPAPFRTADPRLNEAPAPFRAAETREAPSHFREKNRSLDRPAEKNRSLDRPAEKRAPEQHYEVPDPPTSELSSQRSSLRESPTHALSELDKARDYQPVREELRAKAERGELGKERRARQAKQREETALARAEKIANEPRYNVLHRGKENVSANTHTGVEPRQGSDTQSETATHSDIVSRADSDPRESFRRQDSSTSGSDPRRLPAEPSQPKAVPPPKPVEPVPAQPDPRKVVSARRVKDDMSWLKDKQETTFGAPIVPQTVEEILKESPVGVPDAHITSSPPEITSAPPEIKSAPPPMPIAASTYTSLAGAPPITSFPPPEPTSPKPVYATVETQRGDKAPPQFNRIMHQFHDVNSSGPYENERTYENCSISSFRTNKSHHSNRSRTVSPLISPVTSPPPVRAATAAKTLAVPTETDPKPFVRPQGHRKSQGKTRTRRNSASSVPKKGSAQKAAGQLADKNSTIASAIALDTGPDEVTLNELKKSLSADSVIPDNGFPRSYPSYNDAGNTAIVLHPAPAQQKAEFPIGYARKSARTGRKSLAPPKAVDPGEQQKSNIEQLKASISKPLFKGKKEKKEKKGK